MLTRKREGRVKVEKVEGTADLSGSTLQDADAILVLDPSISPSREKIEIPGIGKSLSKEISQFGFPNGQLNFQMLLRGPRVAPVTSEPDWAVPMKACGMQFASLKYLTLDAGSNGLYEHGVTLTFAPSGATAKCIGTASGGDGVNLYYENISGTPTDADTVTAPVSASPQGTGTIKTGQVELDGGYKITPDSVAATSMAIGAFDSGDPVEGDVIKEASSSDVFGVVVSYDSTAGTIVYVPVWGDFESGDTVEIVTGSNAGSSATSSGAPTQSRTPSITYEDRLDGRRQMFTGVRGTWSINLQSGQPARLQFEMQGILSAVDTVALGSPSLTTADGLIFRNAKLKVDDLPMKIAAFELSLAAQVAARLDPSSAKGALSYRLTDRAPTLRLDPEGVVPGVYDWDAKWDASTTFANVAELGGAEGNRVIFETPKAHVAEMSDTDRDGLLANDINCDLTRNSTGDDELAIYVV